MSVRNLLASMELVSSYPVPLKAIVKGTLEIQDEQASSPGSLSSLDNIQKEFNCAVEEVQLPTVCKCGYRQPFCACGFYKFPG